jgi:hypothetical protein
VEDRALTGAAGRRSARAGVTRGDLVRGVLVALPAALVTARNLRAPLPDIVGRVPDDAVFYLVIARNLLAGHGVTFDGRDATTGFHALWLGVVSLALRFTAGPAEGFHALLVLHGLCTVAAVLLLDALLARAGVGAVARGVGAAAAGVWGASTYGIGMETALAAPLVLAVALVGVPAVSRVRGWPFGLGLALGLTRIDLLPLLLVAGSRSALALVGGACGVGLTLRLNHAIAGEMWSTAAQLKGMGTVGDRLARLDAAAVWRHVPAPAVAAIVVLVASSAILRVWPRGRVASAGDTHAAARRPALLPVPLALGIAGGAAHLVASHLFNNLVGPWYFAPLTWLLMAGALVAAARVRGGALLTAALAVACLRGAGLPAPGLHATVLRFADAVATSAPPEARIVAEDFPGLLAWFSGRDVLPADGLAAAPGYRAALETGAAMRWWRARGATHYAVTRRRRAWLGTDPSADQIAPPFLPVPPSRVPFAASTLSAITEDADSGRIFAIVPLVDAGVEAGGGSDRATGRAREGASIPGAAGAAPTSTPAPALGATPALRPP